MSETIINQIGNWNPQLFREIKGRLNKKNLGIATFISLTIQFLVFLFMRGQLPESYQTYHRYCVGTPPPDAYNDYYYGNSVGNNYCVKDAFGSITHIFHQLWWLDLFVALSVVGIFILLVGGTYMLIADLSKEENKGTLNFIRLSPQSAKNIFIGKILGVPILVYFICLLAIPFHLIAGIMAHISLPLIFVFYLVTIFSCVFFYHGALLYGLISSSLMGFQSFFGSGMVLFFLLCATPMALHDNMILHNSLDWLIMFYPAAILPYVIHSSLINPDTVYFLKLSELQGLQFYGQTLWDNLFSATGFMVLNYSIWSYWLSQGIKRRFHNPLTTLITKKQSYWITACFMVMNLGFILQNQNSYIYDTFALGLFFNLCLFLVLTAALSPHRQELQDWIRYRHQKANRRNLLRDLILGEKTPSTLAIALNILMTIMYFTPGILIFNAYKDEKIGLLWGLVLCGITALLYASISQFILYLKTPKRAIWAGVIISSMMIFPYIILGIMNFNPGDHWLWLFTMLPVIATRDYMPSMMFFSLMTQVVAIAVFNTQITRQLKKAGQSETKTILAHS
jgi:hypothetical protein